MGKKKRNAKTKKSGSIKTKESKKTNRGEKAGEIDKASGGDRAIGDDKTRVQITGRCITEDQRIEGWKIGGGSAESKKTSILVVTGIMSCLLTSFHFGGCCYLLLA